MTVDEVLAALRKKAAEDPAVRKALLATRETDRPIENFCRLSTEFGCPIYEMDLVCAGEEYYAAMRRSTNGGGENSPMLSGEDDYYEMFMAELDY